MRRVKLLSNLSHEKLVVIGTNFLSYKIIPKIFGILRKKYPHVEMTANFGSGYPKKELYSMLESGNANLMINYTCNESKFDYIPLHKEKFVVAVRRDGITDERLFSFAVPYSEIVTDTVKEERIISDYSLFKNVEFLRVSKNSSIQSYVHKFIENASVSSCHTYNSNTLEEHYYMMENGLGAVITTDYLIKNIPENKDVLYFITDFQENCRQAKILYNKNTSLSNSAKAFAEIAKEMLTKK